MQKLRFFSDYLAAKYGHKLYRIPLDAGFSCPNRASDGTGGCAFCSANGSRAGGIKKGMTLEEQVASGLASAKSRYSAEPPYIAYFQAFTGTNTTPDVLKSSCEKVLASADFPVLVIATRPDCLGDGILSVLEELSKKCELWIELGVQTSNDRTLRLIDRGHDFACSCDAAEKLHSRGIKCAAHVILGLPGETEKDFAATAEAIGKCAFDAVKVHNLLVLKGTKLEKMYDDGLVKTLNEYEYASLLAEFVRHLPDGMLLMRLSSDAPQDEIVSPSWWMKKGQFLDLFKSVFDGHGGNGVSSFAPCLTGDGTYTLYHPEYKQHFHSLAGAFEESEKKYLSPCRVREKISEGKNISILEVGFGLGCNACSAMSLAGQVGKGKIFFTSLEADRNVLDAAMSLPGNPRLDVIREIAEKGRYECPYGSIDVLWGDARTSLACMKGHFDCIFLDAFSPDANPELWTKEFVSTLASLLKEDGFLASYSSAFPFLGALIQAGFTIYNSKPFGRRRGGIVASLGANPWLPPLSVKDYMIATKSTAGLPYRDAGLRHKREEIILRRQEDVASARSEGMPKWYVDKAKKRQKSR